MENLVALVQITSTDDVRENLKKIEGFVQQARQSGAKMVLLPECCGFMQKHRTQLRQTAEGFGQGMIQDALSGMAKEHSIWVLAGSVPIQSNDTEKVINTCLVYDDLGVIAVIGDRQAGGIVILHRVIYPQSIYRPSSFGIFLVKAMTGYNFPNVQPLLGSIPTFHAHLLRLTLFAS